MTSFFLFCIFFQAIFFFFQQFEAEFTFHLGKTNPLCIGEKIHVFTWGHRSNVHLQSQIIFANKPKLIQCDENYLSRFDVCPDDHFT